MENDPVPFISPPLFPTPSFLSVFEAQQMHRSSRKDIKRMVESAAFVATQKKNLNQTEAVLQMKLVCLQFIKLFLQAPRFLHIFFPADICIE